MKKLVVAIDGPAGAGKSTIGKELAKRLDIPYFSTGALYRALALKCIEKNLDAKLPENAEKIAKNTDISIKFEGQRQYIYLDNVDVSDKIYTNNVSDVASQISVHPVIRQKLVDLQRKLADEHSIIMDGRDIGSVVLKDADYKFYLDADAKVRAERRCKELLEKGQKVKFEEIYSQILERDKRDKSRENSPLVICEDAHIVDCSHLTIEEVVDKFVEIINNKN